MAKDLSRFKRTITPKTTESRNQQLRKIDPRVKLSRQIRENAKQVNEMLRALQDKGYVNTWASKTLFNKVDTPTLNIVSGNRINVNAITKNKSVSQLNFIKKSLNDFKASKTSTIKGIESRVKDQRNFIAEQTDNREFADELSEEEIEQIYEVFNDENYKKLTESGEYDSDEVFSFVTNAKEEQMGVNQFMRTIQMYSEDNPDADTKRAFRNIYNKFVKTQM